MYNRSVKQWFSIIEILIGMFIFSLWIISVYALISSSLRINEYNKNYIIWVNLAREQLELIRNNRDYNYYKIQQFDQINPANSGFSNTLTWAYYKVENNFLNTANFPVKITEISDVLDDTDYEVCINDITHLYSYDCSAGNQKTNFFKYIKIEKNTEENQLLITSIVKWKIKGLHDFELKTILTDWKQL